MTVQELLLNASEQGVYFYLKNNKLTYKAKKNSLPQELKKKILEHQTEIKGYLNSTNKKEWLTLPAIKAVADRNQPLAASFSQQRLWFIDQLEGSLQYNIQGHMELQGQLDLAAFKKALKCLLTRHEVLRTHFTLVGGEVMQIIVDEFDLLLGEYDLSGLSDADKSKKIRQFKQQEAEAPFNLGQDLMLRFRLLKISNQHHLFLYTMHHIASDGWSSGIFKRELGVLYNAFSSGQADPLTPLTIQYADFAQWQRQWLQGAVLDQQLGYWQKKLSGLPQVHSLPLDKTRPKQQLYRGHAFTQVFEQALNRQLKLVCERYGVTLFMFLETVLAVLLSRYSHETDIVVGTPVAGRNHDDVESLIGFFINTLVLRSDLSDNPFFSDLLKTNKQIILDAFEHQHIPFEMLVETIRPERDMSYSALFQILFVVQNTGSELVDVSIERPSNKDDFLASITEVNINFDLTLHAVEMGEELLLNWSFRDSLFSDETISRMATSYGILLRGLIASMMANEERRIAELDIVPPKERECLLVDWNDTGVIYSPTQCIHQVFEKQVAKTPEAVAVIFNDRQMSYRELNEQSNRLAHYLIAQGVTPDSLVGLSVERSFEAMTGLFGILKSGGAYVPLDPSYPPARLAYMLEDSRADWVVTQSRWLENIPRKVQQTICLDNSDCQSGLDQCAATNPKLLTLNAAHAAYVIYTSGSTGRPKGVVVNHASVHNYLQYGRAQYLSDDIKGSVVSSPLAFDATVVSLYLPLCVGKYVELLAEDELLLNNLADYLIDDEDPLLFKITPTHLKALSNHTYVEKNPLVRHVIVVGGEQLTHEIIQPWRERLPNAIFINEYGPTEATVGSSIFRVSGDDNLNVNQAVPIGRPLANAQCYVLDRSRQLQPIGAPGELYIGGAGLAREYLNQPALTEKKFVVHPFSGNTDERLYKTGDLVRYLEDGNLMYIGRIDEQVKLRGFRIELGEIESQLLQHEMVTESVVQARANESGDNRLVAYVVLSNVVEEDHERTTNYQAILHSYLEDSLPDYMIPAAYVSLDKLPMTPNGKVDKKALPAPAVGAYARSDYIAPISEVEILLAGLWAELLQLEAGEISTSDNFFTLGGHSLLVMKLIARLQDHGFHTDVRTLFNTTTLGELAISLDKADDSNLSFTAPPNLIPTGCEQITPDLLPLVTLSESEISLIVSKVPGGALNIQDIYPLVPLQEGILFHHLMTPEQDLYVLDKIFVIEQSTQVDGLLAALQQVINRHDVLRTAIITEELSKPVQVVQREATLQVHHITLETDEALQSDRLALRKHLPGMVLSEAPLLRVMVAAVGDSGPYYFHLQSHHIISDHVGSDVLWSEVETCLSGQAKQLPPSAPYREFVAHTQHQTEHSDAHAYFTEQLGDISEPTLPFDLVDVLGDGQAVERAHDILSPVLSQKIRAVAQSLQMSPASLFHIAWALVVSRCSGCDDVVFGTVLSGRLQGTSGAERMLGLFLNTLPIRITLQGQNVKLLAEETDKRLKSLLNYEQVSLALAQRCSGVSNELPLFSAILNYRHSSKGVSQSSVQDSSDSQESGGIRGLGGLEKTNYPFELAVSDWGDEFSIHSIIDSRIDAGRVVNYVVTALTALIDALEGEEELAVTSLSIIPASERRQLLLDWNDTRVDYPQDKCIHELFEAQVEKNPDALAVVFDCNQLSYGELNRRSNQLARYLIAQGVGPEVYVGICVERSIEMVVGILGILKSGGAYVPIDPNYPKERLHYLLADSGVEILLSQVNLETLFPASRQRLLFLDDKKTSAILSDQPQTDINKKSIGLSPANPCYVIYTSGSTGQPKGVMGLHRSVVNRVNWLEKSIGIKTYDVLCQKTSLGFVDHAAEIFQALSTGVPLVIVSTEVLQTPPLLAQALNAWQITQITLVPSLLQVLLDSKVMKVPRLRAIYSSGEVLNLPDMGKFYQCFPRSRLFNIYGSTEIGADVSAYEQSPQPGELTHQPGSGVEERASKIGKAIANTEAYVLGSQGELVALGVVGELYIAGVGLSRGYLSRAGLTAERFVPHLFSQAPGERLFRTGDLVRYLSTGDLDYVGRVDHQVKIRGFRIEPGEIESVLLQHEAVKDVVVLARGDEPENTRLVAYVVTMKNAAEVGSQEHRQSQSDNSGFNGDILKHCQMRLPDYMVPSVYISLPSIPLSPNGKIDKKALPLPDSKDFQRETYVAPRDEVEKKLCQIWQDQLKIEQVGIHDNFFTLGGHSVLAMRLISLIRQEFEVELGLKVLYESRTIEGLSENIKATLIKAKNPIVRISSQEYYDISAEQKKYWVTNQINMTYNWNSSIVQRLIPVGFLDIEKLEQALVNVLQRHEVFRSTIHVVQGKLKQKIHEHLSIDLSKNFIDISKMDDQTAEIVNIKKLESNQIFDISALPQFSIKLIKTTGDYYILLSVDHVCVDLISMTILERELIETYQQLVEKRNPKKTPNRVNFRDYSTWEYQEVYGKNSDRHKKYWNGLLIKELEAFNPLRYICDYSHNSTSSYRDLYQNQVKQIACKVDPQFADIAYGAISHISINPSKVSGYKFSIDKELYFSLKDIADKFQVMFSVLAISSVNILLHKLTGQEKAVMSIISDARVHEDLLDMVGSFAHDVLFLSEVKSQMDIGTICKLVENKLNSAYEHHVYPMMEIASGLDIPYAGMHTVRLNFMRQDKIKMEQIKPRHTDGGIADTDIYLRIIAYQNGMVVDCQYSRELFKAEEIESIMQYYLSLLKAIVQNIDKPISHFEGLQGYPLFV